MLTRRLPNLLTLIIAKSSTPGMANVACLHDAGILDETIETAGISHLTEHLVAGSAGVSGSIQTDRSLYLARCPPGSLYASVARIKESLVSPPDASACAREKKVIIHEMNRDQDHPEFCHQSAVTKTVYSGRLALPVSGTIATLEHLTPDDVTRQIKSSHIGDRLYFSVSTPEDLNKTADDLEILLTEIPAGKAGASPAILLPTGQIALAEATDKLARVSLVFAVPTMASDEYYAMDLLNTIFSGGKFSPLQRLKTICPQIAAVRCSLTGDRPFGMLRIDLVTQPEPDIVLIAIERTIESLRAALIRQIPQQEVQTAAKLIQTRNLLGSESAEQKIVLSALLAMHGISDAGDNTQISETTLHLLSKVGRGYLTPNRVNTTITMPIPERLTAESVRSRINEAFRTKVGQSATTTPAEIPSLNRMLSHPQMTIHRGNETGALGSVLLSKPIDWSLEYGQNRGIHTILAKAASSRAFNLNHSQLSSVLEQHGAHLAGFTSIDLWGFQVVCPSSSLSEMEVLLAGILENDRLDSEQIRMEKALWTAKASRSKTAADVAREQMIQTLFSNHPYLAFGTQPRASSPQLNEENLNTIWNRIRKEAGWNLVLSHDTQKGTKSAPACPSPAGLTRHYEAPHLYGHEVHTETQTTQAAVAVAIAFPVTSSVIAAFDILSSAANSRTGPVQSALRRGNPICYELAAKYFSGIQGGLFYICGVTSPDLVSTAKKLLQQALNKLFKISESEFQLFKSASILRLASSTQTAGVRTQVLAMELQNIPQCRHGSIESLTLDAFTTTLAPYSDPQKWLISTASPLGMDKCTE